MATSLPRLSLAKDKIRVLLLEGVNDSAVQLIEAYAEYARDAFTVQAGRQFLPSRLGSYGL